MTGNPAGQRVVRWLLSGRVQNIGFRYFVRSLARELGLSGRVRNLPDGRVEIAAAGDPETLAHFEQEVRIGPPGARVAGVEQVEERAEARAPWDGFEIDH